MLLLSGLQPSGRAQQPAPKPLLVGYFGQWSLYGNPKYTLRDLADRDEAGMLDQLNYAQGFVTGGHCSIADRNADLDHVFEASDSVDGTKDDPASPFRGYFHQLAELKRRQPKLKVLISLEGRGSDFAFDAQPENRQAFVASCVSLFIQGEIGPGMKVPGLFDGIDVDWEYPQNADAANFLALLTEFRQQMDRVRSNLKLTIAVGPSPRMYSGTDFHAAAAQVDEVGLMTYDMAGPWMKNTGFIAPLYRVQPPTDVPQDAVTPVAAPVVPGRGSGSSIASTIHDLAVSAAPPLRPSGGVSGSVQAFLAAGVPAGKLLVGVPFYGYGWTEVPDFAAGVFQEGTPVQGDRPYREIEPLFAASTLHRDPVSQTPWLFDGDVFWTFDDPVSIGAKAAYVLEQKLGGLMIWELSNDTNEGALLTAAHHGLAP